MRLPIPSYPWYAKYYEAWQFQGNRVKESCGDEACEEVVIPGGDFAAESEGILSPGSLD
jgi:hypothetical protein